MLRERILHPPPARFSLACLPLKRGGKLLLPRMKFTSPSMGEVGAKRRAGVISELLKGGSSGNPMIKPQGVTPMNTDDLNASRSKILIRVIPF